MDYQNGIYSDIPGTRERTTFFGSGLYVGQPSVELEGFKKVSGLIQHNGIGGRIFESCADYKYYLNGEVFDHPAVQLIIDCAVAACLDKLREGGSFPSVVKFKFPPEEYRPFYEGAIKGWNTVKTKEFFASQVDRPSR